MFRKFLKPLLCQGVDCDVCGACQSVCLFILSQSGMAGAVDPTLSNVYKLLHGMRVKIDIEAGDFVLFLYMIVMLMVWFYIGFHMVTVTKYQVSCDFFECVIIYGSVWLNSPELQRRGGIAWLWPWRTVQYSGHRVSGHVLLPTIPESPLVPRAPRYWRLCLHS